MHRKPKTLLFILWIVMAMPLWVGAGEQAPAEGKTPAAETIASDDRNPADNAPTAAADHSTDRQPGKPESFASIELDRFVEQEQRAAGGGKKLIKMAVPVSFEAKLKRQPEQRQMEYVYTALEMAGVHPMPEVHHRMFIESGEGRIIPVYVEDSAVKKLNAGLKEEEKALFQGYHVYSYAKGPAILVVDFAAIP